MIYTTDSAMTVTMPIEAYKKLMECKKTLDDIVNTNFVSYDRYSDLYIRVSDDFVSNEIKKLKESNDDILDRNYYLLKRLEELESMNFIQWIKYKLK